VEAANGMRWWTDAVSWLLRDTPGLGIWVLMWLVFLLIQLPLRGLAIGGGALAFVVSFVLSGGLMAAAHKSEARQTPSLRDLFAGFGPRGGALAGTGLLVLVASAVVVGLMALVGLGALIRFFAGTMASLGDGDDAALVPAGIGLGTWLSLMACLLLFVPISMAAWLAPALVVLRGAGAVEALRLSLAACMSNGGALTVYGVVFIGMALLATVTFMLGWLLLGPLMFLSTYAACRDLFADADLIDAAPAATRA
jgi:uncharacterized membrane protein